MSEVRIIENNLALYDRQLVFEDELPVVAAYLRVSTDDQVDDGHSLSAQEKFNREACSRKFGEGKFHIIWVRDEGLSGRLPYHRDGLRKGQYRPGLTVVTQLAARGTITHLCVYKCNRLARHPRVWYELDEDFLQPNHVVFFSACEPVDNQTGSGQFITDLTMATSRQEREQIVSACRHGQQVRLASGYPLGQPGYGWQLEDKRQLRRGQRVGIEPVPEQAEVVKQMVEWFLSGWNPPKIAQELSRQGTLSPRGRREWSKNSVRQILMDPHHAGLIRVPKDISETQLMLGVHWDRRIIEESTYYLVQEKLKTNAGIPRSTRISTSHIFGELAFCGVCGRRMRLVSRPGLPTRYKCPTDGGDASHQTYSVRLDWVEGKILDAIRSLALRPESMAVAEDELRRLVDEQDGDLEAQERKLRSQLTRNESEFVSARRDYSGGELTRVEYEAIRNDLREGREVLERQIAELCEQIRQRKGREEKFRLAAEALKDFDGVWESLELDEKRAFADYLIEHLRFSFDDTTVQVALKLVFTDEQVLSFPSRGRGGRTSTGLDTLSVAELTTAHFLLQGHSQKEIAEIRGVHLDSVREYVRFLVRRTGASSLDEALEIVRPVVEERKDELMLDRRRGRRFEEIFTPRQIQILELTAQGLKMHEIGQLLGIDKFTVGHHRRTIYQKLGVHRAQDALRLARERGLISGANEWSDKPTPEQMELLRELARGGTQQEVADRLEITLNAVKSRLKRMSAKFRKEKTADLVELAAQKGWLD